jgi:hypothetical protein
MRKRVNTSDYFKLLHSLIMYHFLQLLIQMDINMEDYLMAPPTDHELTHSGSEQSLYSDRSHCVTSGYEVCVHVCIEGGCISQKPGMILWHKEGHAVHRHATNAKVHQECTRRCPGKCLLGMLSTLHARGRDTTY